MSDTKISALADGTSLQAADKLVVARSGANVSLTGTELAASFDAAGAAAAAQAASQPLDADLTAIAALNSATAGGIASDGAGWIKKTYAQFKTALGLTSSDVGLGNVTNAAQLTASQLDTDGTLAANSDSLVASQKATKTYVDAVAQGLSPKASVRVASAAALPTNTYLAGVITITATGTLTVDGKVTALNDRILVKDEAAQANNGIYLCTTAGAVGVAAVLTRATDSNTGAKILGGYVFVEDGTVNAAAGFVNTNTSAPTIGTTAITYTQFSGAGEITAGAGMTKTGNTLDVVGTANRIVVAADAVDVGSSVYVAGGTDVAVADGGTGSSTAADARTALGAAPANPLATDSLWDAAGDLVVGSGADTAVKLSKGSAGQVATINATTVKWATYTPMSYPPTGFAFENFPRIAITGGAGALTSGTLHMTAIWLPEGYSVSNIGMVTGATAEASGTHAWASLYDNTRALLRQGTDETGAAAVGSAALHTFTLTSAYVTTYSGLHYIGLNVTAGTTPTFQSCAGIASSLAVAPVLNGNTTDTGLTTTAPNPAAAITGALNVFYVCV